MKKRHWDFQQRFSSRLTPKKTFHKRAKSSVTSAGDLRQCFISEDKKSVVHLDKKGICVTQITKATSRGVFMAKSTKGTDESCSDLSDESSDESDDIKVDIQKISENIVREIEESLANNAEAIGGLTTDQKGAHNSKDCFSSFFGSGCRKLIESLMKKTVEGGHNARSTTLEEDTDESLSIDSSVGRCSHGHDHHDSCQGNGDDQRERFGRCDCCYCTYMANDMPPRNDSRRNEEIRQRLRKVLKQREEKTINRSHNSVSSDTRVSNTVEKDMPNEPIENRTVDELLQFINEKTPAENATSAKAAKKARQKQRKLEEKLKKAEEHEKLQKEKEQKQVKNEFNDKPQLDKSKEVSEEKLPVNNKQENTEKKVESKSKKKNEERTASAEYKTSEKRKIAETGRPAEKTHSATPNRIRDDVITASSAFITPTKLSRAFEGEATVNAAVKGLNSLILTSSTSKKEEKPKLSFKSQAALASRAAQESKRTETKHEEHGAKSHTCRNATLTTNLKAKHAGAQPKTPTKTRTESAKRQTGMQKTSQMATLATGQNHPKVDQLSRVNSFAQSVARGIKSSKQPTNADGAGDLQRGSQQGSKQTINNVAALNTDNAQGHLTNVSKAENSKTVPIKQEETLANTVVYQNSSSEEEFLKKRAAMIAAAATAAGTPLPPLASLTSEQQQKYFAWINQIEKQLNAQSGDAPHPYPADNLQQYINEASQHQSDVLQKQITQSQQKRVPEYDKQAWNLNYGHQKSQQQQLRIPTPNRDIGAIGSGRPPKPQNDQRPGSAQLMSQSPFNLTPQVMIRPDISAGHINNMRESSVTNMSPQYPAIITCGVPAGDAIGQRIPCATSNQTSNPSAAARFGAIGEKPVPRKTFNQYAAYDRETNHIIGLSHSPLNASVLSQASLPLNGGMSVDRNTNVYSISCEMNRNMPEINAQKRLPLSFVSGAENGDLSFNRINDDLLNLHSQSVLLQNPPSFSRPVSVTNCDMDCNSKQRHLNSTSSIWQNDDDAKRFVESEECSVFKFFEC